MTRKEKEQLEKAINLLLDEDPRYFNEAISILLGMLGIEDVVWKALQCTKTISVYELLKRKE